MEQRGRYNARRHEQDRTSKMERRSMLQFSQCFGDRVMDLTEADILSAVAYNHDGSLIATGDKGGRIVILKKDPYSEHGRPRYDFHLEFQSHEAEFDYLKSLEIEEKINQIRWCSSPGTGNMLLSTNDKTVKLWKMKDVPLMDHTVGSDSGSRDGEYARSVSGSTLSSSSEFSMSEEDLGASGGGFGGEGQSQAYQEIRIPAPARRGSRTTTACKQVYANAHAYHINSIAPSPDHETFMSSDDLRINLWHMEDPLRSYNIVDIKPAIMEELQEVITSADLESRYGNTLLYSSSKGCIRVYDMRASALCDRGARSLQSTTPLSGPQANFFTEIVASISDARFLNDPRYVISRDFLTVKVWDLAMESNPVTTIPVHDHLKNRLCELYESDHIFDKFEVCASPDGKHIATGTYSNAFHCAERSGRSVHTMEVNKPNLKRRLSNSGRVILGMKDGRSRGGGAGDRLNIGNEPINFQQKILNMDWSPAGDSVAVAGLNKLTLFTVGV